MITVSTTLQAKMMKYQQWLRAVKCIRRVLVSNYSSNVKRIQDIEATKQMKPSGISKIIGQSLS